MRVDAWGLPPPVTIHRGLARVAGLTQRSKVALIMRTTLREWLDVMHLGRWRDPPCFLAVLTQRVGREIPLAYLLPRLVVAAVNLWVALVLAIACSLNFRVHRAVALVGELRAAGIPARLCWTLRHCSPPFACMAKPSTESYWGLDLITDCLPQ